MTIFEYIEILLNLVSQFTGGRGGIDHVIVNFGIASMFWTILLLVALAKRKSDRQPREVLLIWGFGFGLARDFLMLAMAVTVAFGLISNDTLHIIFPPAEHALSNLAQVVVAAAFVLFLTSNRTATVRFLKVSTIAIVACYLATAFWWADFIVANPTAKFGQVWCDWLFRIVASSLLLWPILFLLKHAEGRSRNVVVTALIFFFLHEFLKIPDMALGEAYESVFAPIRHGLYIAAIPMFGYIYVREQADELQHTMENLEELVKVRTGELEVALNHLQIEIRKKEETASELEAFACSVAHDLKSPLLGINGVTSMLVEDYGSTLDSEANEHLHYIADGSSRMSTLIDDLLEYSRVGRGALDFEMVELDDVVARVIRSLRDNIQKSGANVQVNGNLPAIHGNSITLEMMLQNLVANAIKFCRSDVVPDIVVSAEQDEGNVVLSIKDNGIGIKEKSQSRIFDIFHRLHDEDAYEGTGIGLAIVKKAVLLHNGTLHVQSTWGEGCEFLIRLPIETETDVMSKAA